MLSQYEELRVEITNRFPNLEKSKEFQKKWKIDWKKLNILYIVIVK
jgi:hypothetical protein